MTTLTKREAVPLQSASKTPFDQVAPFDSTYVVCIKGPLPGSTVQVTDPNECGSGISAINHAWNRRKTDGQGNHMYVEYNDWECATPTIARTEETGIYYSCSRSGMTAVAVDPAQKKS